ncbi:YopX family protein [Robertmurraya siralis]|uniref:YopX family protein n=1 Tax=Robertmurraya siralis TaxID=77777 RepID=UPI001476995D|nr:YopX family protein [Robertmurraya siralis]
MKLPKFRVYEPLNKKMHYLDFTLYEFSGGLNSHKFVLPPKHQGMQNPYTMMNLETVEVMQFTGLHDRAGSEIYIGDVVQLGNYEQPYEVMVNDYMQIPVIDNDLGQENLFKIHKNCRVIGNIYDMPDWNF